MNIDPFDPRVSSEEAIANFRKVKDLMNRDTIPTPSPSSKTNLDHLADIAKEDVAGLLKAQQSYGDSWKRRGGVGAFMMLARKWDRLENGLRPGDGSCSHRANFATKIGDCDGNPAPYDIFAALEMDKRAEGFIDDVRDLRRYLMLVEAEARARGSLHGTHRDNT